MKRVAIVTPSITVGDAVSNDVVGMYRVLQKLGFDTRNYCGELDSQDSQNLATGRHPALSQKTG